MDQVGIRDRRSFGRRLLRAFVNVVSALVLVVLAGVAFQAVVEHEQRGHYPPPGELIDIGDGQLVHLRTWGADQPDASRPTILLDISANLPSSTWAWIAQDLARDYRVVAYDRPGMAWSRARSGPPDAMSAAEALSAALEAAGIDPPYVVVGHSYGGFSARVFTGLRRADIVGLVLLDSTTPVGDGAGFHAFYRARAWLGHTGALHLLPWPSELAMLPDDEAESADAVSRWLSHLNASADELGAWFDSAAQVRAADDALRDLPLLVVSGLGGEAHLARQRGLAQLSSRSAFVELPVGHVSMLTDPDQATLVAVEIRRFVDRLPAATNTAQARNRRADPAADGP